MFFILMCMSLVCILHQQSSLGHTNLPSQSIRKYSLSFNYDMHIGWPFHWKAPEPETRIWPLSISYAYELCNTRTNMWYTFLSRGFAKWSTWGSNYMRHEFPGGKFLFVRAVYHFLCDFLSSSQTTCTKMWKGPIFCDLRPPWGSTQMFWHSHINYQLLG